MFFKRYISKDVTPNAITSAYRYVPNREEEIKLKGEINALVTVTGDGSFQSDRAVKFVWDGIVDAYLFSSSGSSIDNVKRAMEAGAKKLVELMKNDKDLEQKGINLSFAVAVFKEKTAYLGVFGEEDIYIYKNGDFVNLSEILSENKGTVASIALEDDDLVLLSSPLLLSSFAKTVEAGTDPADLLKRLTLFSNDMTGNQGVLFLSRKVYEEEVEPEATVENIEAEEVTEELVEEDLPVEGEAVVETDSVAVPEKKSLLDKVLNEQQREQVTKIWTKIVAFWEAVKVKSRPVIDGLARILGSIWMRIRKILDDQFGRKIWYKKIMSRFSTIKVGDGQSAYGMKIDGYKLKDLRGKRLVSAGIIALAILVVIFGIKLSVQAREGRELHQEVVTITDTVKEYLDEADRKILSDKAAAETAVFQAGEEMDKLDGKELSIDDGKAVTDLKKRLQDLDDRLNKRAGLDEDDGSLESFIDTRLAFGESSNPTDLIINRDEFQAEYLYIADKGLGAVYRVALFDKSDIKLPDSNQVLVAPTYIDVGVEGIYVYDESVGVVKSPFDSSGNNGDFVGLVGLGAEDLGIDSVSELAIFTQSDNVYLLSRSQKAVLKSNRTGSGGYGLPFTYISADTFSSSTDIFGDLSIYVLTSGTSGLERYTFNSETGQATLLPVSIIGLSPEFENLTAGYTGATLDNKMYVFDAQEKRLIVFEKPKETTGDSLHPNEMWLVGQYVYRGNRDDVFKDVKDIVVDAQEDNAYILDGNRVWRVELE